MTKPNSSPVPSPKGTRDFYPEQMLRENYITRLWRDTAVRHGFEEINGPTFEMLELYTRKSGEGIVSELFRFRREGGDDDYALRPEFTPTLARMYAAKAASLPSPTKWFSIGPYFRAEKPQRGRLREFLQWNVDVLGLPEPASALRQLGKAREDFGPTAMAAEVDAELVRCMLAMLEVSGLSQSTCRVQLNDRRTVDRVYERLGVPESMRGDVLRLHDAFAKLGKSKVAEQLVKLSLDPTLLERAIAALTDRTELYDEFTSLSVEQQQRLLTGQAHRVLVQLCLKETDQAKWTRYDPSIVRGLAYYTGTVFEVIAEGERAIAGGGRYDNLIELFGGPPTPAVGFGMGDVVLGLLLDDKGLMPQGAELMDALSRPGASLRPEAFVVAGSEDEDALVEPLLANLRRGVEREGFDGKPWAADRYAVRPMHARRTYKTTRNLKKLLADAEKQFARFAIVLHGPDKVQVKDLDKREELVHDRGDFSVDPKSEAYVGKAIAARFGY